MDPDQRVYAYGPYGSSPVAQEARPANLRVRLLSAVNSMPPLPAALSRLMRMLNSDAISATQVAAVIEGDSVLSGSVMKCVNSAYYGMPRRVSSIRHAVTLLGFQTVRNLALAFSMRRMMTGSAASRKLYGSYARHALATALLAQNAAVRVSGGDIESAFAAGLFHDVGKLLIYTAAPEAVPSILKRMEESGCSYLEAERETLETTHAELSAIVLEGWKLPDMICVAARYHHEPQLAAAPADGAPSLTALVHAADMAVNFEGFRTPDGLPNPPQDPAATLASLQLGGIDLLESFRAEFENLQEMFG
ncbi:MAG: HDOD domain-containing protein [Bryobacterales bacterium]